MVKVRLEEDSICYRIPDLQCLPLLLDLIEVGVHREDMDVIVWVGYPINGPGLAVNKLRVDYVRARAIFQLITFADLGFHPAPISVMVWSSALPINSSTTLSPFTAR